MRVSILLPVIDETASLRKTVEIVLLANRTDIAEILIIACDKTTPAAIGVCNELARSYPHLIQLRFQQRPFLGGAMRDAFEWASGSHVLMMASDLETAPETAKELITAAKEGYDIVTATRWTRRGAIHGYNPLKYVLNWIFQKFFRLLYGTSLSDLTFGYRIFKTELVKKIKWEELRHPFLFETIIKPLRLGAQVAEVPTSWHPRPEGVSHNPFFRNFVYFRIGLKTRFRSKQALLRSTS
jgi:glycosyltransferase involved in cell wall biosynthesis